MEVAGIEGLGISASMLDFFLTSKAHSFCLIFAIDDKKGAFLLSLTAQSVPKWLLVLPHDSCLSLHQPLLNAALCICARNGVNGIL